MSKKTILRLLIILTCVAILTISGSASAGVNNGETSTYLPLVRHFVQPIQNWNFEQGRVAWTEFSTHNWLLILNKGLPVGVAPYSGTWAVWLGGDFNDISYIEQSVSIPVWTPYLVYYRWIGSEEGSCLYDYAYVMVNGSTVDSYGLCGPENTNGWQRRTVNLTLYAGNTVTLRFQVVTDNSLNSNLFLDDITLVEYAPSADVRQAPLSALDGLPDTWLDDLAPEAGSKR
jgi:hypothetical protein